MRILEKLVAEKPDVAKFRDDLAGTYQNVGSFYLRTRRINKGLSSYRKSLEIREKLAEENPTITAYRDRLAMIHNNIAIVYENINQLEQALVWREKLLVNRKKITSEFPNSLARLVNLGGDYVNVGNIYSRTKEFEKAKQHYDSGVKTLSPLVLNNPSIAKSKMYLRNAHWGRAKLLQKMEKYEESVADWKNAIKYDEGWSRGRLQNEFASALVSLSKTENHLVAYREARKLAEENKKRPTLQYNIACVVSMVCEAIKKDKTLSPSKKTELLSQYSTEAIGFLKTAKDLGFFNPSRQKKLIQTDSDLDAIRNHEDFQKLLKEIEADTAAVRSGGFTRSSRGIVSSLPMR